MRKITLTLGILLSTILCHAVDLDKITDEHLSRVKGVEYNETNAKSFVEQYIGIFSEGKSDYLFHTETEELVALFKGGIQKAKMIEVVKTSGMTNVYFMINDVMIHTSYKNSTGEMYMCRFKKDGIDIK
ncbi:MULTISPECIES: hypothetical protein [Flammeovirga]|uniref:DUF3887 domain-containing protein n=1 Tax=Flammeovirga agarivorans TaxID=2726742 RepID=A0A7X8XUC1_9BACT|nr:MULTISPECIES: hypothetical protein [Flammeovirga]NLR90213.1 hypothetical protein [Flammeovirga agarivorans]